MQSSKLDKPKPHKRGNLIHFFRGWTKRECFHIILVLVLFSAFIFYIISLLQDHGNKEFGAALIAGACALLVNDLARLLDRRNQRLNTIQVLSSNMAAILRMLNVARAPAVRDKDDDFIKGKRKFPAFMGEQDFFSVYQSQVDNMGVLPEAVTHDIVKFYEYIRGSREVRQILEKIFDKKESEWELYYTLSVRSMFNLFYYAMFYGLRALNQLNYADEGDNKAFEEIKKDKIFKKCEDALIKGVAVKWDDEPESDVGEDSSVTESELLAKEMSHR